MTNKLKHWCCHASLNPIPAPALALLLSKFVSICPALLRFLSKHFGLTVCKLKTWWVCYNNSLYFRFISPKISTLSACSYQANARKQHFCAKCANYLTLIASMENKYKNTGIHICMISWKRGDVLLANDWWRKWDGALAVKTPPSLTN